MARNDRFTDKVVFVTGAASGIGRAAAIAFAAEGARVAILDRSADALEKVKSSVESAGGEVLTVVCDVSSPDQVEDAVEQVVHRFGRLDVAFNNAGVNSESDKMLDTSDEEWTEAFDQTLMPAIRASRLAIPARKSWSTMF